MNSLAYSLPSGLFKYLYGLQALLLQKSKPISYQNIRIYSHAILNIILPIRFGKHYKFWFWNYLATVKWQNWFKKIYYIEGKHQSLIGKIKCIISKFKEKCTGWKYLLTTCKIRRRKLKTVVFLLSQEEWTKCPVGFWPNERQE